MTLFTVCRTSGDKFDDEGNLIEASPCPGAFKTSFQRWDCRTCDEAEFDRRGKKYDWHDAPWRAHGSGHREWVNGGVRRLMGMQTLWVVQVDDPVAFMREHGTIEISPCCYAMQGSDDAPPNLEIVDAPRY